MLIYDDEGGRDAVCCNQVEPRQLPYLAGLQPNGRTGVPRRERAQWLNLFLITMTLSAALSFNLEYFKSMLGGEGERFSQSKSRRRRALAKEAEMP